jgi:hypothetical protein
MLEWLFQDERKFFAQFSGVAQGLTAAARLLEQGFDAPARFAGLSTSIERVDHETDAAAQALALGADRMFIPPMDREDIHLLSTRLRRVVDIVGGAARRAVSLRATERHEGVRLASCRMSANATFPTGVASTPGARGAWPGLTCRRSYERLLPQSRVRLSNCALTATITVLSDMSTAPMAGDSRIPARASTPAASGIATML